MSGTEDIECDEVVIGLGGKFFVTLAWLLLSAIPSFILAILSVRLRAANGANCDFVILPLLWLACLTLSARAFARILGDVDDVGTQPPTQLELHHLPHACAGMVHEAMSIRADVDDIKDALLRAWRLTQEVDQAPPDIRELLDRYGATLDPVRQLFENSKHVVRRPLSDEQLRQRLVAALLAFEHALRHPRTIGFRS